MLVLSHVWLFGDPMDCSLPDSSVDGIFQVRVLEWVAISSSRGDLPNPGIKPASTAPPSLAGGFFTTEPPGKSRIGGERKKLKLEN